MTSHDNGLANTTNGSRRNLRTALYVTTAVAAALPMAAQADYIVAASTDTATANAAIAGGNVTPANTVTVNAGVTIASLVPPGPTQLNILPAGANGVAAVTFTNNGNIGTVTAGAISDRPSTSWSRVRRSRLTGAAEYAEPSPTTG